MVSKEEATAGEYLRVVADGLMRSAVLAAELGQTREALVLANAEIARLKALVPSGIPEKK